MKRHTFAIGAVAVAFALGTAPSLAQERGAGQAGSRPAGGSERTGSASPRGEASGAGSSRSSGGEARGGGGVSGGAMGTSSSPSAPSSSGSWGSSSRGSGYSERSAAERAPRRDDGQGQATGRRAVPRGASAASGSGSTSRETSSISAPERTAGSSTDRRAVPIGNRPREGRQVTGTAVERVVGRPSGGDIFYIYRPYYNPYGFYGPGFGYGLGYLYYDPFWYGGYSGFGYPGYGYYGGGGSGYYSSGGYGQTYRDAGSLRLKIKPRDAQVFVDGYFVGVVDSFDGAFQKLTLDGGGHRIEIKAEGFEPVQFEVLITPGETVTYKGELVPIK